MADKWQIQLEKIESSRNNKIKELKIEKAKLRKPTSNAEALSINTKIKTLKTEIEKLANDYNAYYKTAIAERKNAEINAKITTLTNQKNTATARGEDTATISAAIAKAKGQIVTVTPAVKPVPVLTPTVLTGDAATAAAAAAAKTKADAATAKAAADKAATAKAAADKAAADKAAADKAAADKAAADKIKASQDAVKVQWINNMKVAINTITDEKEKNEIISVLDRAVKEQWAKEDVYTQLQTNSTWWQKNSASYKNWYLFANDPSRAQEYKDTLGSTSVSITNSLETLGIKLNQMGPDGKLITQDKIDALINGMSVDLVRQGITASGDGFNDYMATNANIIFTGGGEIGSSFDKIKMQAMRYGIDLNNPTYAKQINYSLLDPNDGKDLQYYLKEMQTQSADLYPMFAKSINSGRSLYEITNNYRNQMAGLLEIDASNITWTDLMAKVINKTTATEGSQVANTFADFNKLVKQDPLWQNTKNAKDTYSNMALDLAKQFGFVG